jgi:hypothetical protein
MKTCRAETLTSRVERVIEPRVFFLALVVSLQYLERVWGLGFGVRCLVFRVRCYCRVPRNQVPKVGSNPLNGPLVEWFTLCQPNLRGRTDDQFLCRANPRSRAADKPSAEQTCEAERTTRSFAKQTYESKRITMSSTEKTCEQSGQPTLRMAPRGGAPY